MAYLADPKFKPATRKNKKMRLAPYIRANAPQIICEWETFAATLVPAANCMSPRYLRDHIKEMLAFIANDIEAPQTGAEQATKSRGGKPKTVKPSAAETHAALRLEGGFDLDEMVSEFRALRASVTKLWEKQLEAPVPVDIADLTRFNESLDQILTESIHQYSTKMGASKDLLVGILSHDLSHMLNSVTVAAGFTLRIGRLHERQMSLASEIIDNAARASETVAHLLDLTRARLGSGLPVIREPVDMEFVSKRVVDEMRMLHSRRDFNVEVSGNLDGNWDKARVAQLVANLLDNAVRYSFADSTISVAVSGSDNEVTLSVHNEGVPIPAGGIPNIFKSLNRAAAHDDDSPSQSVNLGLGLYIAEEIVTAHGGVISVESSEKEGTTFTVKLPRSPVGDMRAEIEVS